LGDVPEAVDALGAGASDGSGVGVWVSSGDVLAVVDGSGARVLAGGGESSGSDGGEGGGDLDETSGTGLSWRMATWCTRRWMRCARMRGGSITCTGICGSGAGTCMKSYDYRVSRGGGFLYAARLRASVEPQQPRRRSVAPISASAPPGSSRTDLTTSRPGRTVRAVRSRHALQKGLASRGRTWRNS
jgi:hypothetical protein